MYIRLVRSEMVYKTVCVPLFGVCLDTNQVKGYFVVFQNDQTDK